MIEAALDIHWQRARRRSPRDQAESALECPLAYPFPCCLSRGVRAGEGRGRSWPPRNWPRADSSPGERARRTDATRRKCQSPVHVLSLGVKCQPHGQQPPPPRSLTKWQGDISWLEAGRALVEPASPVSSLGGEPTSQRQGDHTKGRSPGPGQGRPGHRGCHVSREAGPLLSCEPLKLLPSDRSGRQDGDLSENISKGSQKWVLP